MKKLTFLIAFTIFITQGFAQDFKKFRFGLKGAPNLSWFKADATGLSNKGVKPRFSYGLITEFALSDNYSFATGIEVSALGGALNFGDSVFYLTSNAGGITEFYLNERHYNFQFVEIPLTLKLKTNEIGYMRYFGQFGVNAGFRTRARAEDQGTYSGGYEANLPDRDISKDIQLPRLALNVGAGVEYNLVGNTALVVSANYNKGFTNALKKNSNELRSKNGEALAQRALANYVALTVGIIF
jgi:hypothetical protein